MMHRVIQVEPTPLLAHAKAPPRVCMPASTPICFTQFKRNYLSARSLRNAKASFRSRLPLLLMSCWIAFVNAVKQISKHRGCCFLPDRACVARRQASMRDEANMNLLGMVGALLSICCMKRLPPACDCVGNAMVKNTPRQGRVRVRPSPV